MDAPHLQTQTPGAVDAHGTWLISFADLLTLLLCAFLMMFSLNWEKQQHVPNLSKDMDNASQTESHGIVIALTGSESKEVKALEQRVEIRFSKDDFAPDGATLKGEMRNKVKNIAISDGYRDATVTLSIAQEANSGEPVGIDRHRLLRIAGQLLDVGVPEQKLRYEILGPNQRGSRTETGLEALVIFERDGNG